MTQEMTHPRPGGHVCTKFVTGLVGTGDRGRERRFLRPQRIARWRGRAPSQSIAPPLGKHKNNTTGRLHQIRVTGKQGGFQNCERDESFQTGGIKASTSAAKSVWIVTAPRRPEPMSFQKRREASQCPENTTESPHGTAPPRPRSCILRS